ncbi:MAG: UDP-2,3-diacylglucosamine diphosphatase [Gammaproteobacteria bacterium]|nr:UDP-2,3-diacylglucosamine diphosphatase [Gammaproteobacteria bacterium]MDE2252628.1 UDP-2,3-diacylglucosamine diphosphatase [Gammaproteobacteria bacterium]
MDTLFVSDLHLDAALPAAIEQFEAFALGPARGAAAVYVLGDLFESWVGDDDDDAARARVCAALRALAASGVACYACHGNRDFLLAAQFERRSGCRLIGDPTVIDLYGERVLLAHGDLLCTGDRDYQRLRSVVRAPAWQRRFLRLPLATRRLLADTARAGSRTHTGMAAPEIMDVSEPAVIAAFRAAGVRRLIHGHTHRPGVHAYTLDGASAQRYVLGAWYEHGSVLRCSPGRYQLQTLPG